MALADRYLYEGEHVLAVLAGEPGNRELAATERRVVCVQGTGFYDVSYGSLASVGCGPVWQPAWAYASFLLAAVAVLFGGLASLLPRGIPVGPFSIGLGGLVALVQFPGTVAAAFAVVAAMIFLLTARRAITLCTPGKLFVFGYEKGREDQALALVKVIRSAGVQGHN